MSKPDWPGLIAHLRWAVPRRQRRYLEQQVNRGHRGIQRHATHQARRIGEQLKVWARYVDGEGKARVAASRARAADRAEARARRLGKASAETRT